MATQNQIADLYSEHMQDVFRYAMFKLHDKESAEDATSETFLRLVRQDKLEDIKNKKAWIIGITRNVIYEIYREQKTEAVTDLTDEDSEPIDNMEFTPEQSAITEQLYEILKNKLDELDDITSEIIILRTWQELQFDEIADIVQQKITTVKLKYYRGVEKLKQLIEKDKRSTKLGVLLIPAVLGGIMKFGGESQFKATPAFATHLQSVLQTQGMPNTNINLNTKMQPTQPVAKATTSKSLLAKITATTSGKALLVGGAALTLVAVGAGAAVIYTNSVSTNNNGANSTLSSTSSSSSSSANTISSATSSASAVPTYSYVNSTYNFSIDYPTDYLLSILNDKAAYVAQPGQSGKAVNFAVEADMDSYPMLNGKTIASTSSLSFNEYALDRGTIFCAIGPNGCSSVASQKTIQRADQVTELEIYYNYSNQGKVEVVGPVYAFDIQKASQGKARILFIYDVPKNQGQIVTDIAASVKIGTGLATQISYRDYMIDGLKGNTIQTWATTDDAGDPNHYNLQLVLTSDQETNYADFSAAMDRIRGFLKAGNWTKKSQSAMGAALITEEYTNPVNGRGLTLMYNAVVGAPSLNISFEYRMADTVSVGK